MLNKKLNEMYFTYKYASPAYDNYLFFFLITIYFPIIMN